MNEIELRIGNFVRAKSPERTHFEEPVKVTIGYLDMFIHKGCHMEPIPLTEKWLKRFGFRESGSVIFLRVRYQRYTLGRNSLYSINGKSFIYSVNDHDLCEIGSVHQLQNLLCEIGSVHQLQNLYFALTNEELTYKPE